jgi:hypothetical protein
VDAFQCAFIIYVLCVLFCRCVAVESGCLSVRLFVCFAVLFCRCVAVDSGCLSVRLFFQFPVCYFVGVSRWTVDASLCAFFFCFACAILSASRGGQWMLLGAPFCFCRLLMMLAERCNSNTNGSIDGNERLPVATKKYMTKKRLTNRDIYFQI